MLSKCTGNKVLPQLFKRSFHTSFRYRQQQSFSDSFLNGNNSVYLEQMYENWRNDRKSVHSSWDAYFTNVENGVSNEQAFQLPPNQGSGTGTQGQSGQDDANKAAQDSLRLRELLESYCRRGHEIANVDPLHLDKLEEQSGVKGIRRQHRELDPETYGFKKEDFNKQVLIDSGMFKGKLFEKRWMKVGDAIDKLKQIYCSETGVEYDHIQDREERSWIREQYESFFVSSTVTKDHKMKIFHRLCKNEMFTNFLKNRFTTSKRFGIEGCDSVISGLIALVDRAAEHKVEKIIMGMPHRGRLNTLTNVLEKPFEDIFSEFQELHAFLDEEAWGNSGDVKYHLGTTLDKKFENGHEMSLSILANPSHLEAVNPPVTGKTRAFQDFIRDTNKNKVMGLLLHGDAAFAAQGVVYETIQMQDLIDFTVGGTIHVVINNQIGFTTTPREARTSLYCTDIAKTVDAPIIHVNADEPELVDLALEFAVEYRMKYKKDIVIDVIGYRRYGHNELDQPSFTQPLMYKIIDKTPPVYKKYAQKLLDEGVITQEQIDEIEGSYNTVLEEAYQKSRTAKFDHAKWISRAFEDIVEPTKKHGNMRDTGIALDTLKEIGLKISTIPDSFTPHPQIKKIYQNRVKSLEEGKGIDWATGEALAWATLLTDGYGVRLSGQDVERGTFSHRHAVLNDQKQDKKMMPIAGVISEEERHKYIVCNSHLSETGVLGFEYGYSISNPNYLCQWEAQFGDFANCAQSPIDNFIVSGESKWGISNGLVMMLPHGYDGQGPEHSSARLERFLQMSDDDVFNVMSDKDFNSDREKHIRITNMQVCVPTTASNYFHLLRRQLRRTFRKPLIVMSPKKLLKFKGATSTIEEFQQGYRFRRVYFEQYPEEINDQDKIKKIIFCSGQVYYDLVERRRTTEAKDTAILRVEQIAPFPYDQIRKAFRTYKNAHDIIWVQEEHYNGGGWGFVHERFNNATKEFNLPAIRYVGRKASASTAAGTGKLHNIELENQILNPAFPKKK